MAASGIVPARNPHDPIVRDANKAVERAAMQQILPPELFSGFLAISADAVIAVDDEQRIIFFNEGAERIFGYTADEVGGQYLAMLLPERFRPTHRGHVRGVRRGARPRAADGRAPGDLAGCASRGRSFPPRRRSSGWRSTGSNVYAAVLRDVSARYRAEEALHQAIRARDDMMGIVSHDLRNPASAVKMLARSILAEAERARAPAGRDGARRDHAAGRGADRRADPGPARRDAAGGGTAHRVGARRGAGAARRGGVVRAAHAERERRASRSRRRTRSRCPMVHADPERVTQLLSNLVGNALKFTPAGGRVDVRVRAAWRRRDGERRATPARGSPPTSFRTCSTASIRCPAAGRGSRHGAGLGLTIARGIVEAHGGTISIESAPGRGTTVRFTLPGARGRSVGRFGGRASRTKRFARGRHLISGHGERALSGTTCGDDPPVRTRRARARRRGRARRPRAPRRRGRIRAAVPPACGTRVRALPAAGRGADGGARAGAGHVRPRVGGAAALSRRVEPDDVAASDRGERDARASAPATAGVRRASRWRRTMRTTRRARRWRRVRRAGGRRHGDRSGAGDRRAAAGRAPRVRAARSRGVHARGGRRDDRARDGHAARAAPSGATTVDQGTEPMNEHTIFRRPARRADGRAPARDRAAPRAVERDPRRARAALDERVAVGSAGVSRRRGC